MKRDAILNVVQNVVFFLPLSILYLLIPNCFIIYCVTQILKHWNKR